MNTLFTKSGNYKIIQLLSTSFPFCVYRAADKSGKDVIIKTTFNEEETITSTIEAYSNFHSHDLKTSIFYGHNKADIPQINGDQLLKKQYNYLSQCSGEYNITNCLLENDLNGKSFLIYDFIKGLNFNESDISSKSDLFIRMIPSLLTAVSKYPHGDLSFENLIIHENGKKFSIIDPAINYENIFFTNLEFYPLVPPLFFPTKNDYATYADQLAIGLMLYKLLSGKNPLEKLSDFPFWVRGFGNGIGGCITDDIYSTISVLPKSWEVSFCFDSYIGAIRSQLKLLRFNHTNFEFIRMTGVECAKIDFPSDFFEIIPPANLNQNISKDLSDFCMSLIHNYEPINWYIYKVSQLTKPKLH